MVEIMGPKATIGLVYLLDILHPIMYNNDSADDGVVILYSSFPSGATSPFDLGRTLTHELGH